MNAGGDEAPIVVEVIGPAPPAYPAPAARAPAVEAALGPIARAMTALGERLNPILVKETRQALKSRQFMFTFAALLLCGWGWSLLGTAMLGPSWTTAAVGREMFFGYYIVLAFPLLVVAPFSAFRSLVAERDDRTHELLSITTLRPWQIVTGKLGSTVVQMLVYLSALAPCLAFTYLLRGIDIVSIGTVLVGTVVGSLVFSCVALMLATGASERHWQVLLSVAVIAALLLAYFSALIMAYDVLDSTAQYAGSSGFWLFFATLALLGVTYAGVALLAAAAELSFAADNRATRLRVGLFVQQMILAGWLLWLWLFASHGDLGFPLVMLMLGTFHWWVCGAIMTGESAELSPRVKRELPTSFFGRVFLTWFNPGPGTGYVFAVINVVALGALVGAVIGWDPFTAYYERTGHALAARWAREDYGQARTAWDPQHLSQLAVVAVLLPCYMIFYLGLGRLLLGWLRRFISLHVVAVVVLQALLVAAGVAIPMTIHLSLPASRGDYHWIEAPNLFLTIAEMVDAPRTGPSPYTPMILLLVPTAAAIVFVLNLRTLAKEVAHTRIAKPVRVVEDELQAAGASSAAATSPFSPP